MIYSKELKQQKKDLQEELQNEMRMLEYYRKEVKRHEMITNALQDRIDGIDCELRGEVNK